MLKNKIGASRFSAGFFVVVVFLLHLQKKRDKIIHKERRSR
jgi:hypothetical protein